MMSDAVKWALLAAAIVGVVVLILALPFAKWLDLQGLQEALNVINTVGGSAFYDVRAFINYFLFDWARNILSGIMLYLFIKWVFKLTIKITTWIFHWIFK